MLPENAKEIICISPFLKRMIHDNTAIRMNNIALCISMKSRNIQYIYNIRILIGNSDRIVSKSLIVSMNPGTGKNKYLGFSGNYCIRYDIIPILDLIFKIFL